MTKTVAIRPDKRWEVIMSDPGSWRVGIYRPECAAPEAVTELERHTCPELFICMKGAMGLVTWDGETEKILTMQPEDALLTEDYHNGFALDPQGYFIVVERTQFATEYIDRATRNFVRAVEVK